MKQFMSVILAVVLVVAVAASLAHGTFAGFLDTEVSTDNYMHASYINLTVNGQDDERGDIIQPFHIGPICPDKPYQEEIVLCNIGTVAGNASIHFQNVLGHEAGDIDGKVWNGSSYVIGSPVGSGVASSEPELAAEEATTPLGYLDSIPIYATDDGTASGTPLLIPDTANLEDYVMVTVYWDTSDDGIFTPDEMVDLDPDPTKTMYTLPLGELECKTITLGELGAANALSVPGSGWGSYFAYDTATDGTVVKPLIAGQRWDVGTVTVSYDNTTLTVEFQTLWGWTMTETQVYAKHDPPIKPGKKDWYKHLNLDHVTTDIHYISIDPDTIYIAAHAVVWSPWGKNETAWAQGKCRKLKLHFIFPDIPEADFIHPELGPMPIYLFPDDSPFDHWPTNAYQGDKVTFDIVYKLTGDP